MTTVYDDNGKEVKIGKDLEAARQAAFGQIKKKAILVDLTVKQIANLPFDIVTSNTIAKTMGVQDPNMLQVRKLLFNPQHLSRIRSLINDAMLLVWNYTRPWENIGYRLLPMEYYDDLTAKFGKIKDEFEESVKEFINNYDDYVTESESLLGPTAFNKSFYPDKAQVSQYFKLELQTSVLPDVDDIRVNMSGPELLEMQQQITNRYSDALTTAKSQLVKTLNNFSVSDELALKLVSVLETLNNLSGDQSIEMQIEELKDKFNKSKESQPISMMVADDLDSLDEYDNLI